VPWAPGARLVVALDRAIARAPGGPLLAAGEAVLVACSGGVDSTCLAYALTAAGARFGRGWRLTLAHVHHGLRGEDADRDADHVREMARRIGAGHVEARVDVAARRRARGGSVEEAGRGLRYAFLAEAARARGIAKVATAHHEGDQVETVLHRALRGTGVKGLAGIPARRALAPGVEVVRPLLGFPRAGIEAYLAETGIAARADESNQAVTFTRNRLRHEALPLLRDIAPGVDGALVRLARIAAETEGILGAIVEARLARLSRPDRVPLALLSGDPPALAALVLTRAVERASGTALLSRHRDLVAALLAAKGAGGAVSLPGGVVLRRGRAELEIEVSRGRPGLEVG